MELTFSELENIESKNYWEQPKVEIPKKKKVSFDDILTNMNLVVNKNGVLQSMIPTQNVFSQEENYSQPQQQYSQSYSQQYSQQYRQPQQPPQQQSLDPSVKHSYIFNKYFKDYKDAVAPEPEIRKPKTMQEYRQMLLEDRIKRIEQQKRISHIKSTKLMFTTNSGNNGNIQVSNNTLRSMSFR